MKGTYITVTAADGGRFKAYMAVPASGRGPGIVLCQEIFGVNAYVREVAELYAEEGYVVLAPDLFWRMQPMVDMGYSPEDGRRRSSSSRSSTSMPASRTSRPACRPCAGGRNAPASRHDRPLPGRQARLPGGGARRRRLRGRLLRRRNRRTE